MYLYTKHVNSKKKKNVVALNLSHRLVRRPFMSVLVMATQMYCPSSVRLELNWTLLTM